MTAARASDGLCACIRHACSDAAAKGGWTNPQLQPFYTTPSGADPSTVMSDTLAVSATPALAAPTAASLQGPYSAAPCQIACKVLAQRSQHKKLHMQSISNRLAGWQFRCGGMFQLLQLCGKRQGHGAVALHTQLTHASQPPVAMSWSSAPLAASLRHGDTLRVSAVQSPDTSVPAAVAAAAAAE